MAALVLEHGGDEALLVSARDTPHHARAILADLRAEGPCVFERCNAGPGGTLLYHAAPAEGAAAQ